MSVEIAPHADELRKRTLEAVKQHKASWIRLGQYLFTVYKDKLYKSWDYQTFEGYCRKELNIKQATASKLLKSYAFVEREEPRLVNVSDTEDDVTTKIPDYESVNILRLAKENAELTPQDIAEVRDSVIEKVREPKEVRAQVKKILEEKNPIAYEEQMRMKLNVTIRRVVSMLRGMKRDFSKEKLIPDYLLTQMTDFSDKLEDQLK